MRGAGVDELQQVFAQAHFGGHPERELRQHDAGVLVHPGRQRLAALLQPGGGVLVIEVVDVRVRQPLFLSDDNRVRFIAECLKPVDVVGVIVADDDVLHSPPGVEHGHVLLHIS
jgi:hypothetical protein